MLEGDLSDFTLPDILQLLAFTAKSGRLSITGEATTGCVDIEEGRLLDASSDAGRLPLARRLLGRGLIDWDDLEPVLTGRDELPSDLELAAALVEAGALEPGALKDLAHEQTVDALFDLLRWERGTFRFDADHRVDRPAALDVTGWPPDELMAEATSRLEDWADVEARSGPSEAVVTIGHPAGDTPTISPEGWTLLALTDGRRTVGELAVLSGQGEYRTRRTLAELADAGVVTIGAADPSPVDRLLRAHGTLAELESAVAGADRLAATEEVDEPSALAGELAGSEEPASEADAAPDGFGEADGADALGAFEAFAEAEASDPSDDSAIPDVFELEVPADDETEGSDDATGWDDAAATPEPTVPPPVPPPGHDEGQEPGPEAAEDAGSADEPEPEPEPEPEAEPEPEPAAVDQTGVEHEPEPVPEDEAGEVTPLRARDRKAERLRTDPSVDADMIERLIDGVESL